MSGPCTFCAGRAAFCTKCGGYEKEIDDAEKVSQPVKPPPPFDRTELFQLTQMAANLGQFKWDPDVAAKLNALSTHAINQLYKVIEHEQPKEGQSDTANSEDRQGSE